MEIKTMKATTTKRSNKTNTNNNLVFNEYQNNIFDFVSRGTGNAVISAVAGSGKTTTIIQAATLIPKNKEVLFLAFNKSIVTELSEKLLLYKNIEVKTLHSHGLASLKNRYKFIRVLTCNRFFKTVKEQSTTFSKVLSVDSPSEMIYTYNRNSLKLLDLCRINLIYSNEIDKIKSIAEMYSIECIADEINFVSYLLKTAYDFPENKCIDFTDMLSLSTTNEMVKYVKKYDYIFIDECQDLSTAQRALMLNSLKKDGRFIAVGDRKQAINGFAGATCNSFDLLVNLPNTKEFPLSVNYRCGKKIIDLVKDIVPNIEPYKNSIEGTINEKNDFSGLQNGDMVLCRITSPLVGLCLKLWKKNITAYVKGSDICDSLLSIIYKANVYSVTQLFDKLDAEKENLVKNLSDKGVKKPTDTLAYLNFKDKIECIECIAQRTKSNNVSDVVNEIKTIFKDIENNKAVCLSTVHKAKGLEADNVWIILPDKLPLNRKNQKAWEKEQEFNLKYVAYTRAKKVLNLVNLSKEELMKID